MKWPYVIALYIAALSIFGCCIYSRMTEKKEPIRIAVRRLLFCAAAALCAHATAIFLPTAAAANLVFGVYNCCIDAMVFSLLLYVRRYTGLAPLFRGERWLVSAAMGVDCLFMLTNPLTGMDYHVEQALDGLGCAYFHVTGRGVLNVYHLAFVYLTMLLLMGELVRKVLGTPKIYKIKYAAVFVTLCIVLVLHAAYLNFSFNFDYSLFFYAIIAFSVFYFSLFYVPKGLIESLLLYTVANMENGIICVDIDGKCVYINKAAGQYCQSVNGAEGIEQKLQEEFARRPELRDKDLLWETIRVIDGEERHFEDEYKRIIDENGRYLGCFFILHDMTDEYYRIEQEKYRATHDALTGIFNKEYFYEKAEQMLEVNPDKQFCMVCTDIKNFKLINDMFGMKKGDTILKKAAMIISGLATKYTVYGRLSADRFALLMLRENMRGTQFLAESAKLKELLDNNVFKLHVHVGVYEVTDPTLKVSIMCDRAMLAIQSIKDSYQSSVAFYDENLRDFCINEQKVISEFEQAIRSGQFHAYIQPQISADGRIIGGEALVRWLHPDEGLVAPYKFIDIYERTGLISRLDPYIWELACIQLKKWKDEGRQHYISVNISPKDFLLINVYETLVSLVERYGIDPRRLHLEITETCIMDNPGEQLPLIDRLRSYGFIVEIDDFGSGYSSLNTLKDLTADALKIDMGFLRKTENTDRSMTILKMIVALAKSLNMEVITEGVETKEQVDFLTEFGCDVFQGYFFAKPMPVADFEMKYLEPV